MKNLFRKMFSPILNIFEKGNEPFEIKPSSRKILIVLSLLFTFLASVVFYLKPSDADNTYYLPIVIFGGIAFIGLIVGLLGTDRAVAKIWGSRS